jgi:hypothetical protein
MLIAKTFPVKGRIVERRIVRSEKPYVLCVDVGGPTKIRWADDEGRDGTGADLGEASSVLKVLQKP